MNVDIKKRGRGIAWCYTLFLSLMFLLPQKVFAVVETVRYTMNPEDVSCISTIMEGEKYTRVEWNGRFSSQQEEGAPDIPCDHVSFLVPQNTHNFRVSVSTSNGNSVTRILGESVMPVQPMVSLNTNPEDIKFVKADQSLYDNISLPHAEVVGDGFIFGNQHIVQVAVYPISYSDVDKALRIEPEMELSLEYDYCDVSELMDMPLDGSRTSSGSRSLLSNFNFINQSATNRFLTGDTRANSDSPSVTSDLYYIIVPENLKDGVQDLALWKRQKGYYTNVVTIESILKSPDYKIGKRAPVSGELIVDEASSLRAYLQDEFVHNGSFYCLLVGDWRTTMPIRKSLGHSYDPADKGKMDPDYSSNANGSRFIPTDKYFSDLTTNWNLTNGYCSEYIIPSSMSCYPDIFVGRLLCSTNEELDNYFQKLRIYESYPGKGDDSYLMNALYFEQHAENGRTSVLGYTQKANNELNIFDNVTFVQDLCYLDDPTKKPLPHYGKDIINYMSRMGYSSWGGHGRPTMVETCNYKHNGTLDLYAIIPITSYTSKQIDYTPVPDDKPNGLDAIDNVNYPGVVFSMACTITPFDRFEYEDKYENYIKIADGHVFDIPYNMGSAYTVAGLNGGVALIGNTRDGYFGYSDVQQKYFGRQIKKTPKIGIAQAISKTISHTHYFTIDAQNLIGEPEFEMWLNRPQKFDLKQEGGARPDFSGVDLTDASCAVYYGESFSSHYDLNGIAPTFPSSMWDKMPMISIWKTGYLPNISLYAQQGEFTNVTKRYMPHQAFFGHKNSTSTSKDCVIGMNAQIDIDVMKSVNIYPGFYAVSGGKVNLKCDEDISASGELVRNGGEVTLCAKKIVLEPGFKVEAGGVMTATTF